MSGSRGGEGVCQNRASFFLFFLKSLTTLTILFQPLTILFLPLLPSPFLLSLSFSRLLFFIKEQLILIISFEYLFCQQIWISWILMFTVLLLTAKICSCYIHFYWLDFEKENFIWHYLMGLKIQRWGMIFTLFGGGKSTLRWKASY